MLSSAVAYLATVKKAVASAVGVAITVLTAYHEIPILPDQPLVVAILAALTAVATWLIPNKAS